MRFHGRFGLVSDKRVIPILLEYLWGDLTAKIAIDARIVNEEAARNIFGVGMLWISHAISLLHK